MTTPTLEPQVLVIGLDPYRVPGPWDPQPPAEAIEVGMARFAEHGVGAQSCLFGLDGSDDPENVVTSALVAQDWQCVVVGGGVRTAEDGLELFELVVNLVRRYAPQAAIAFNATPSDTYEAASRWIEVAKTPQWGWPGDGKGRPASRSRCGAASERPLAVAPSAAGLG